MGRSRKSLLSNVYKLFALKMFKFIYTLDNSTTSSKRTRTTRSVYGVESWQAGRHSTNTGISSYKQPTQLPTLDVAELRMLTRMCGVITMLVRIIIGTSKVGEISKREC